MRVVPPVAKVVDRYGESGGQEDDLDHGARQEGIADGRGCPLACRMDVRREHGDQE
jgi:hypothetical protein